MSKRKEGLVEAPEIPVIVAEILSRRGVAREDMAAFVYPNYERDLHDPYLMRDMEAAVERIVAAAEANETVVVYGDYDIDGITASAVMIEALAALGIEATSYIPDRFEEGYGINQEALEKLKAQGTDLVISVDCGITSVAEAKWAKDNGLDLIITDHHSVPEVLPDAIAVINPKRSDDQYPFKDLAGVGVAFKLAQALQRKTGKPEAGQEKWLLDLVALGTVCDVVTLVGENRALASYGLKVMRRTRRAGLRALAAVGGFEIENVTAYHLGFVLGPRMNAAGRLDHAARSLELMMTGDGKRAAEIAQELDSLNRRRRAEQDHIFEEADAMAEKYADDSVLVLAGKDWSHGVVGIVASKISEKWHKPVLVAQIMGDTVKGSARSVKGFNMVEALRDSSDILTKFGGHFFAAGYTLPSPKLDKLRVNLNKYYRKLKEQPQESPTMVEADVALAGLETVGWPMLDSLELLEPHGSGNPRPLFELAGIELRTLTKMGRESQHLRMGLSDASGRVLAAVGFGFASMHPGLQTGQNLTVKGYLNKNEFQGTSTIQFVLQEITNE